MKVFIGKSNIDLSLITVSPGDGVVVKPNFVKEPKEWQSVIISPVFADGGDQQSLKTRMKQKAVKMARDLALNVPGIGPVIAQKMRKASTAAFGDRKKDVLCVV